MQLRLDSTAYNVFPRDILTAGCHQLITGIPFMFHVLTAHCLNDFVLGQKAVNRAVLLGDIEETQLVQPLSIINGTSTGNDNLTYSSIRRNDDRASCQPLGDSN
jgi:hypothetical protein